MQVYEKLKGLNIAIFIDRDVTVRHFLDSKIFNKLAENNNIKLVFPPFNDKRISAHKNAHKYGFDYEIIKIPERRIQLWKWIFFINIQTFRFGKDWKIIRRFHSLLVGKMKYFFKLSSLPLIKKIIIQIIKIFINKYKINELKDFINSFKPDILIHPSIFQGVYINELALISHKEKIPFLLLMNSWDNPCIKNTSTYEPSLIGVWGPQTKYHAERYMNLNRQKIRILGAAQFECFKEKYTQSREDLLSEYGLKENTTLILYAGSSKGNDEFRHLLYLENICKNTNNNLKIIYRPHPWLSDKETVRKILNHNSKIIMIDNTMIKFMQQIISQSQTSFFSTDYKHTHNILGAADIVISPLSTILIEALCHGKEAICLIPKEEDEGIFSEVWKSLPCFEDVIKSPGIKTVEYLNDLEKILNVSISNCKEEKNLQENKNHARFFVDLDNPKYEERLIDCIAELVEK